MRLCRAGCGEQEDGDRGNPQRRSHCEQHFHLPDCNNRESLCRCAASFANPIRQPHQLNCLRMPMTDGLKTTRQTLMIDADDTLWENNIYFERAIANFISFLNHSHFTAEQVRLKLNEVEHENVVQLGYGLHSFRAALVATFERLSVEPLTPA